MPPPTPPLLLPCSAPIASPRPRVAAILYTTLLQAQRKTKSRWHYASKHARLHRADTRLAGWHSGNGDQPHELMYVHTADCSAMACVPVIDTLCDRAGVIGAPEMRCTICPLVLWAKPDERWRYSEVSSTSTRGAYAYAYAYPHIPARTQERRARPRRRSPLASLGSRSASPVTALGCRGCESRADRQVLALQNKACAPHPMGIRARAAGEAAHASRVAEIPASFFPWVPVPGLFKATGSSGRSMRSRRAFCV